MTRRRKLLVADDSLTIQKVVSLTFSDEGLDVLAASSGEEAIRQLEQDAPDIVLADIFMPGPNGYELCERIKSDPRLRHIPVILLIGTFEPFNQAEARKVGADDVLTKPFQSIRDLVSRVGSLLGGGRAEEDDEPVTQDLHEPADAQPSQTSSSVATAATPRRWDEPSIKASGSSEGAEAGRETTPIAASAVEVSFADIELDDRMIEEKPIESVGVGEEARRRYEESMRQDEAASSYQPAEQPARYQPEELTSRQVSQSFTAARGAGESREVETVSAAQTGFAARAASAATADETLLDLDDFETSSAGGEGDDFILDLADDAPAIHAATPTQEINALTTGELREPEALTFAGGETAEVERDEVFAQPDAPASLAEAAHGEIETAHGEIENAHDEAAIENAHDESADDMPTLITSAQFESEEELHIHSEAQPEHASVHDGHAQPESFTSSAQAFDVPAWSHEIQQANAPRAGASGAPEEFGLHEGEPELNEAFASFTGGQSGGQQLSPEAVEAIARRAVELLSERVVREIAWEVVPQLAELLIKQRLDEERK